MKQFFSNAPSSVFGNPDYTHYIVEYNGDLEKESSNSTTDYITIINDKYAIVSTPFLDPLKDRFTLKRSKFPSIVYVGKYYLYTLQSLSPIVAANINQVQVAPPFYLTGKGVLVGIIDTGIDYLNKEFMGNDGKSRILNIWDQSIKPNVPDKYVPFGAVYFNKDINEAIKASSEGKNPYDIVPSKDLIGHGTAMAGVIGAKGINPEIKGAAPDCEFVVVKLIEDAASMKFHNPSMPIYDEAIIMISLSYLHEYALSVNKPMVIYLPLGTTFGNHKGSGSIESFINEISNYRGFVVTTGSGNEGDAGGHASGKIPIKGQYQDISLNISNEQKFLRLQVWVNKPNVMALEIISASGESSGIIPASLNQSKSINFIFENTVVDVTYFIPEELSGDELIDISMLYLTQGTWKLRLHADSVLDGTFNVWMLQKGLAVDDTKFTYADPYGTFTGPGSAEYIITTANYNQNNFNIVNSSGMSFLNINYNGIDIAAGGINVKTTAPNNNTTIVSGTSISSAVTAGACALLLQWGIVDGKDSAMYSQKIKTYLTRGTEKRATDSYPNAEWGYGVLNLYDAFRYLQ